MVRPLVRNVSTQSSTPPDGARARGTLRYHAQGALEQAMCIANSSQLARLVLGAAQSPGDLTALNRYLDWVESWTATKASGMTEEERVRQKALGRPRDGRTGLYPGRPRAFLDAAHAARLGHPPADNEAHFRWMMLVHSGLRELELEYTILRKVARLGETTMRVLLHGEVWGTKQTRRRLTWHLLVLMLVSWGLEDTVTFVESGGNWLPDDIPEPVWHAEDGRIRVQSPGRAGTAAPRTVFLRLVVVLPDTGGPNGRHAREVTLDWPPVRPRPST